MMSHNQDLLSPKITNNRPQAQTIYQINQRLFIAFQRSVGEQLIACECAG
jgi:hypothetical protein